MLESIPKTQPKGKNSDEPGCPVANIRIAGEAGPRRSEVRPRFSTRSVHRRSSSFGSSIIIERQLERLAQSVIERNMPLKSFANCFAIGEFEWITRTAIRLIVRDDYLLSLQFGSQLSERQKSVGQANKLLIYICGRMRILVVICGS
jgi:hypothetical protein